MKPTDGQRFNCGSKQRAKPDCPYPKNDGSGKGSFAAEVAGRPEEQPPNTEIDEFTRLDGLFNDMFAQQRAAGDSADEHDARHSATARATCRTCALTNDTEVFNQEEPVCVPDQQPRARR